MILLIGGEKGGTGKSVFSCNLSVCLAKAGRDVLLLDADPQRTATNWVNRRNNNYPDLPKINCIQKTGDIFETVRDMADRYEEVIIDAGGRDSEELRTALVTSHKVISPIRPSQDNIETIGRMIKLISHAKSINRVLEPYLIINMASTNPNVKSAAETINLLKEQQDIFTILSDFVVNDYKIFQDANADGLSVIETQHVKAKTQIENVFKFLYSNLVSNKSMVNYG